MSSYVNVTTSYLTALPDIPQKEAGSFEARSLSVASALVTPITCAIDTIVGIGTGIGAVVTGGSISSLNKFARRHIIMSGGLLMFPWKYAISAINPANKISDTPHNLFSSNVCKKINEFAKDCSNSDNPVKKHFVSRLSFALFGLAALVTKLAEAIIGLPFLFLATVTLGHFKNLNKFATLTLNFPGVILFLFISAMGIVNPHD